MISLPLNALFKLTISFFLFLFYSASTLNKAKGQAVQNRLLVQEA